MKLLFDQNLPPRLVKTLADLYPKSVHVRDLGMAAADDRVIWEHAQEAGFAIVSKDSDFQQLSFVFGAPPKVIWIRRGNCSAEEIETVLRSSSDDIEAFGADEESSFLVL